MLKISRREGLSILWFTLGAVYIGLYLPFWKAILLGWIFALAFTPGLDRVRKRLELPRVKSAYGLVGTFVTFVIVLLSFITVHVYSTIVRVLKEPGTAASLTDKWGVIREKIMVWLTNTRILPSAQIRAQIETTLGTIADQAKETLAAAGQMMVTGLPGALLQTVIFFLAFGVFLVGGRGIWHRLSSRLGLSAAAHEKYKEFEHICARSLGSIFLVGFIQSVLTVFGAAIGGYEAWFAVFIITFIFSMIPVVGAGVVPVVLSLLSLLDGNSAAAIILLVTAVIVSSSDNVLRAYLFSRAAKIHPVISLISLLGALQVFGFVGVFVAPVLEQLVMAHFMKDDDVKPEAPAKSVKETFSRAKSGKRPRSTDQYSPATSSSHAPFQSG